MAKSKIFKFNAGIIALLLVVVGLPATYFAATQHNGLDTTSQHAAGLTACGPYTTWTDATEAQSLPSNNTHVYLHVLKLIDVNTGSYCGKISAHVDLDIYPNTPIGIDVVQIFNPYAQLIFSEQTQTISTGSSWKWQNIWFTQTSAVVPHGTCGLQGFTEFRAALHSNVDVWTGKFCV